MAVEWFRQRGHQDIAVYLPQWRTDPGECADPQMRADKDALQQLEQDKMIVWMTSRKLATGSGVFIGRNVSKIVQNVQNNNVY